MPSNNEPQIFGATFNDTVLAKARAHARKMLGDQLGAWYHHADGRPCNVSYGWCFTHMAKALPS